MTSSNLNPAIRSLQADLRKRFAARSRAGLARHLFNDGMRSLIAGIRVLRKAS